MVSFKTKVERFEKKGEKSGWTYIEISSKQADKLKPGCKVSFRVKGMLDDHRIQKTAILPMGAGNFILPLNATLRKATRKKVGDTIQVTLEPDERELTLNEDFVVCLKDDERAWRFFSSLPKSHQVYFSKWIDSAKTSATKTKRITMAVIALGASQGFPEMLRANKGI